MSCFSLADKMFIITNAQNTSHRINLSGNSAEKSSFHVIDGIFKFQ